MSDVWLLFQRLPDYLRRQIINSFPEADQVYLEMDIAPYEITSQYEAPLATMIQQIANTYQQDHPAGASMTPLCVLNPQVSALMGLTNPIQLVQLNNGQVGAVVTPTALLAWWINYTRQNNLRDPEDWPQDALMMQVFGGNPPQNYGQLGQRLNRLIVCNAPVPVTPEMLAAIGDMTRRR